MPVNGAREKIQQAVLQWPGVTAHPHRFGGVEFRLGTREIGHVHGDGLVDIPFPTRIRDEIIASGEAQPHHVLPDSGWISRFLRDEPDIEQAIVLLRRSYNLAEDQKTRKGISK